MNHLKIDVITPENENKTENKWKNLEHYIKQKEQRHLSVRSESWAGSPRLLLSFSYQTTKFLESRKFIH